MHFGSPGFVPELREALYPMPNHAGGEDEWLRLHGYDLPCLAPVTLQRELDRLLLRLVVESDEPDAWLIARRNALIEALHCHRYHLPVPCPPTMPRIAAVMEELRQTEAIYTNRLLAARGVEPASPVNVAPKGGRVCT